MKVSRLWVAIATALIGTPSHAGLIGDTVNASMSAPFAMSVIPGTATVDSGGPEFVLDLGAFGRTVNIDVQNNFVTFTYNNVLSAFFGDCNKRCLLTISGIDDEITGIAVTETDDVVNHVGLFGPNTASFTDHSITLSFDGLWDGTDTVRIDITTRQANVPEPGSLALLGLGLAGLGALRRKRS